MKIICMIPARLGSKRLKQKNLQLFNGKPLIVNALEKVKSISDFDEIWINSESDKIKEVAEQHGIYFHKRPAKLADDNATSEDFVYEFLMKHQCDYIVQLHSIAPLITVKEINSFVEVIRQNKYDVILSTEHIQIECLFENSPINFDFSQKTNSQDLKPIERVSWAITAWKRDVYIENYVQNKCATYGGRIKTVQLPTDSNLVIKTMDDLLKAQRIFNG